MPLKTYQIADQNDSWKLAQSCAQDGHTLLPLVELLCQAGVAVDELIDIAGRATIEAVLTLSARRAARACPQTEKGVISEAGVPQLGAGLWTVAIS